jgi:hypothetical protein
MSGDDEFNKKSPTPVAFFILTQHLARNVIVNLVFLMQSYSAGMFLRLWVCFLD